MKNFEYRIPTKVVFGKDSEKRVGELVKANGGTRVLIHYGGDYVETTGLLKRIQDSIAEAGLTSVVLDGVAANPRLSKVYEGIELCKKEGVDFIVGIGGGSAIDSSKAIGYGVANDCDVWDLYCGKAKPKACLPIGAIVTIAASGSETGNSSLITNEDGWYKRACKTDLAYCKFAIMNPELTYTLPRFQTASGSVDIVMHTLERYLTTETTMQITDGISEALMRTVMRNVKILLKDPTNYEARAEIMWCGSLSNNNLTGCGSVGDWASHQLQLELGAVYDVTHGACLAALWGSWARYVYKTKPQRFVQLAVNVLGVYDDHNDPEKVALEGIERMEDFFRDCGMPTSLTELGLNLTEEDIDNLAFKCSYENTRTIGSFRKLDIEDMKNIYRMAR